jgi:uncharacterized protein with HEPN domain
MKLSESDRAEVSLEHIRVLRSHLTRGELGDQLVLDAVCMQLMASIEQLTPVSNERLIGTFGTEWSEIKATRNAIAHAYDVLEQKLLADTIVNDLDVFERNVRSLITSD